MTFKTVSVYRVDTGEFVDRTFTGDDEFIALNVPEGHAVVEGEFVSRKHRVSDDGSVVAHKPSPPPDTEMTTWSWSEDAWEWLPVETTAAIEARVRRERDARLLASDWVTLRALEQAAAQGQIPAEWRQYRQALRDITEQPGWPSEVVWPVPPA